ncbi:MAG TPA: hypothetical protein DCM38_08400 [Gammaproteobacteria bacterium]|nr:hypothetical protein [Gammaproteobacteria bacterium]
MTSPSYFAEYLPPFLKAMYVVNRELRYWLNTRSRLTNVIPVTAEWISHLEEDQESADIVQSFTSRFGRLQDLMSKRLFRTLILLEGGEAESLIDILNVMEKRGILENLLDWQALRKLRNDLTHEYFDDYQRMAEAINATYAAANVLENIVLNCREYAINNLHISADEINSNT